MFDKNNEFDEEDMFWGDQNYNEELRLPNYVPRFEFGGMIPNHLSDEDKEAMKEDIIFSLKQLHNFILPHPYDETGKYLIKSLLNPKWFLRSKRGLMKQLNMSEEDFEDAVVNNSSEILINPDGKYYLRARALNIPQEVIEHIFQL